jgi:hypothetical protein
MDALDGRNDRRTPTAVAIQSPDRSRADYFAKSEQQGTPKSDTENHHRLLITCRDDV